jgi:hypothetical protein
MLEAALGGRAHRGAVLVSGLGGLLFAGAGLLHLLDRAEHFAPPLAEAAGARLAERSEADAAVAWDVGWSLGLESGEMVALALDTAPWLELPAAAVASAPWADRLLERSARPPREAV